VAVSFGAEDVLEGVRCAVNAGDRVGLVGRNGAGKTTLLRILAGTVAPSSGKRHVARATTTALVEQVAPAASSTSTVRDEALSGITDLLRLESELQEAARALSSGREDANQKYADLHARFEAGGGFTYESRMSQVLTGLGFAKDEFDQPLSTLSGGQRSRLGIARALLAGPDLLLMDEPTNHLDFDGLRWLEGFLNRLPAVRQARAGAFVVASHDRYFLDRVARQVWHLDRGRLRTYRGNYTRFEEQRSADAGRQSSEYAAQQEVIAREEEFIRRYRAGQRAREARGRAKKLARLERVEAPAKSRTAAIKLGSTRTGDLVLGARSLVAGYGRTALVEVGNLDLERGARVALIGANGTGKTTLLRTLSGELPAVAGSLVRGANLRLKHYWQEAEDLVPASTVMEEVMRDTALNPQEGRDLLGLFLFSGDDVLKTVSVLSGGERSLLALARLASSGANLLLLDEPTNHLDIPAREALEGALASYQGTLVFASHDRRFISKLARRLWIVAGGRLVQFEGTFEEYEREQGQRAQAPATPRPAVPRPKAALQVRQSADGARLEAEIEACERRLEELGLEINEASARGDLGAVARLGREFQEVQAELERLVAEWGED